MEGKVHHEARSTKEAHLLQWIGQLPAIITAIIAIFAYFYTQQHDRESLQASAEQEREASVQTANLQRESLEATARKQRQQAFLDKQIAMYFEASQVVSVLATSYDKPTWTKAYRRFWELYWGPLSIVESPNSEKGASSVESHMVAIGTILDATDGDMSKLPGDRADLQQLSLQLAHACRDDIRETWGFKVSGQIK